MSEGRSDVLIRGIAGHSLPGVAEPSPSNVPDDAWAAMFYRVRSERISGLAVQSVVSGWLDLSDEQSTELFSAHRDAMTWCLSVERKLVALADAFDDEGIAFAVLKGPSVAHTAYPDPSLRSFGDLDLLVSTPDYERTCELLGRLGHVRQRPEPRPGFEVRFGKASVHKHPEDDVEIDLHRTLVLGPFGLWMDPEELLERREPFLLGGRKLDRLDDTAMLLNVAMHASLGQRPMRVVPQRDVAQLWVAGDIEWPTLARWAVEWRLAAVLKHAFAAASAAFEMPIPREAARSVASPSTRTEAKLISAYTSPRRNDGGTALATTRAISGIRNKGAYAWALILPERRFVEARAGNGANASYLRRWSVPLRWARARWHVPRPKAGAGGVKKGKA